MKQPSHRLLFSIVTFLVATLCLPHLRAAERQSEPPVAAVVGDVSVTVAELESLTAGRLTRLKSEEYEVKQEVLEGEISRVLLEREAKARGISTEELLRIEVDAKVAPITDAEKRAGYDMSPDRTPGEPAPEVLAEMETRLRQRRAGDLRQALLRSLRAKAGVRVLLDPPRVRVATGDAPVRGPENAPITIVEFSEFQCPYCARVTSTLEQVRAHYGDRVRIVFRHFPLPNHKDAPKASEAALCAGEQRKFWEMHDQLFANQARLQPADLRQRAADLGLNQERFNACLDSGKYAQRVQADVSDGSRYGVTGTPAFFINGMLLVGAVPYESFARMIDDELARTSPPSSARPSP